MYYGGREIDDIQNLISERIISKVTKTSQLTDKVVSGGYLNAAAAVRPLEESEVLADSALYGSGEVAISNNLYRVGGYNSEGYSSSVSTYNIADKHWYQHSELNVPRMHPQVLSSSHGVIWAIGGYDGEISDDVECYTSDQNWQKKTALPKPLCAPTAAFLDNKIYVFGGLSTDGFSDDIYTFNSLRDTWEYVGKMPYKVAFATSQVINEKLYIMGGVNENGVLSDVYEYDLSKTEGQWTALPSMNTARQNAQSITMDGKLYVIGGVVDGQIDFEQNLFTQISESMVVPFLDSVEQFDFVTGEWTECTPMEKPRLGFNAGVIFDQVVLTGGWNGEFIEEDEVYLGAQIPNNVRGKTNGNQLTFMWDPISGADGYEIELDGNIVTYPAGQETTYTITETTDTVHTFRVRAKFGDSYGGWSDLLRKYRYDSLTDALSIDVNQDQWTETVTQLSSPDKLNKWYKISVDIIGNLDIELQGENGETSCILEVYDSAGNLITTGRESNGSKWVDSLPVAMYNYYIRIYDQAGVSENVSLRTKVTQTVDIADVPSRVLAHSAENVQVSDEPSIDSEGNETGSLKFLPENVQTISGPEVYNPESVITEEIIPLQQENINDIQTHATTSNRTDTFYSPGDQKWYSVFLNKGQKLIATVTPPAGGEYGVFVNREGSTEEAWTWYDAYENPDHVTIGEIVASASGNYMINVKSRYNSTPGIYTLNYTILNSGEYDGYEPNFTPFVVNDNLGVGGQASKAPVISALNIDNERDKDYYRISNVQKGDKITLMLETNGNYTANLNKFNFEIWKEKSRTVDPNDGWITVNYDAYHHDNAYFSNYQEKANAKVVSFIANTSADFYVIVRTTGGYYSRNSDDKYKLTCTKVNSGSFGDINEVKGSNDFSNDFIMVNNYKNYSLTQLTSNGATGAIDNELDIDWYELQVASGKTQQVTLSGSDFIKNNCRLYLCQDRGSGNPSLIKMGEDTLTIDQAGTYYVGVYADNWSANGNKEYTLSMNEKSSVPELEFTPVDGESFIYSSNPEFIEESHMGEKNNMLDNYDNLAPGKYTYMAWYHNGTDSPIYTDVLLNAMNSATIKINRLGLQVFPEINPPSWTGMQAYSDFLG